MTDDLDILVSFDSVPGETSCDLITLSPLLNYLEKKGYTDFRKEGLVVEGWPEKRGKITERNRRVATLIRRLSEGRKLKKTKRNK